MFFGWWIEEPAFAPYLQRFAGYYYNHAVHRQRGVAINCKFSAFAEGTAVLDVERGQLDSVTTLLLLCGSGKLGGPSIALWVRRGCTGDPVTADTAHTLSRRPAPA